MRLDSTITARIGVVLGLVGLGVACSVNVDVANKACPCGSGYVCDQGRNLCVLPGAVQLVDGGGQPPGACPEPCPCALDVDCKDPSRPRCSPTKTCVECNRMPDTCPAGSYCNELFQCTLGCKQESDCRLSPTVPHCQIARHQCVECITMADCAGGKACSPSGACVESCGAASPACSKGLCCAALCVDTEADLLNCGGCDLACSTKSGTPSCAASKCGWTCASGFAHCGAGNTGCETSTRTDPLNCGACSKDCNATILNANTTCTAGVCGFTTCKDGFANTNNNPADGCEAQCGRVRNEACCPNDTCGNGLTCNTANRTCK